VAKTLTDVEKKIEILDETEEIHSRRGWKFWVSIPLVLAIVTGSAYLAVRRWFGHSEN